MIDFLSLLLRGLALRVLFGPDFDKPRPRMGDPIVRRRACQTS